jgi:glypican 4 (K-glypican)
VISGCGNLKFARQRRAAPLYNTNSDFFIEDDDDHHMTKRAADPGNNQENRSNRNNNNQEINYEPMKFPRNDYQANRGGGGNRGRSGNSNRSNQRGATYMNGKPDSRESALDKLVKEIRQKVKDTKKFWSNLPYTVCNNEEFTPSHNSDNCWNGLTVNR